MEKKRNSLILLQIFLMKKQFSEKQIHILEIAEKLIAIKGFKETSVRDISTQAGVNVAMISYYFGSKEKMMANLYQYRVQKTRIHFSEFMDTIKEGNPEMQMKEIIKFIVNILFKYDYFHGFATQEYERTNDLKGDLLKFYQLCVVKIDDVVKKGIASGTFRFAPKPEDMLSNILGTTLFVIRNRTFMELYIPNANEKYTQEVEKKVKANLYLSIFALLGYIYA